jgi:hypothetical protein
MGGFPRPKGLGHACKAIMQRIATKLMLALKDVIDRFFNQVPGRTSFAAFILYLDQDLRELLAD